VLSVIGLTFGAPIDEPSDESHDLSDSDESLNPLANILMSPHISDALDHKMDKISTFSELKSSGELPSLDMSSLHLPSFDITSNALTDGLLHANTGTASLSHSLSLPSLNLQSAAGSVHTSHLIQASKDSVIGAAKLPLQVSAEAQAVGGAIPAAAAVKGSLVSSAIATPILVKAVALPGLAAAKTAAAMSVPHLFLQNVHSLPEMVSNRLKTSFGNIGHSLSLPTIGHNLAELVVVEDADQLENEGLVAFNKDTEHLNKALLALKAIPLGLKAIPLKLKAGAIGLKAKTVGLASIPLLLAKKGVYKIGRIILKPVELFAGANLKMLGSGLLLGGKLIGGTGAGIAKAGTAIKYAGLGGIGVGASAVSWGFDKSTIESHDDLNAGIESHFEARVDDHLADNLIE